MSGPIRFKRCGDGCVGIVDGWWMAFGIRWLRGLVGPKCLFLSVVAVDIGQCLAVFGASAVWCAIRITGLGWVGQCLAVFAIACWAILFDVVALYFGCLFLWWYGSTFYGVALEIWSDNLCHIPFLDRPCHVKWDWFESRHANTGLMMVWLTRKVLLYTLLFTGLIIFDGWINHPMGHLIDESMDPTVWMFSFLSNALIAV